MSSLDNRADWPEILGRMQEDSLARIAADLGVPPGMIVSAWRRSDRGEIDLWEKVEDRSPGGAAGALAWRVVFGRGDDRSEGVVIASTLKRARELAETARGVAPASVVAIGKVVST